MKSLKRWSLFSLIALVLISSLAACAQKPAAESTEGNEQAEEVATGMPDRMVWSTFGVGSSTYVQAAGIADALTTKLGTQVRILPSDTGVGRVRGLLGDNVDYTISADESYFATYGLYDFAAYDLGPQSNLRAVLARPGATTAVTTKKSGIVSPYDFKGSKLVWIPGSTSVNIKAVAFLAFAGLTLDDVELITAPSYGAGIELIKNGGADWMIGVVTASYWYELDTMDRGLHFVEFPTDDQEAWKRLQEITPWLYPGSVDKGAGITESIEIAAYVNPLFMTTSEKSEDEVYSVIKAIDEAYELYKDVGPLMPGWKIEAASGFPVQAPYHEGAVLYFKEKGLWTEEHEQWNNQYLEDIGAVEQAWVQFVDESAQEGVKEKELHNRWIVKLEEVLGREFPENY
jgi:TRAP transporter TAXI family solute receptor